MLEIRTYTKAEMVEILHTKDNQGIKRKLNNYGVEYSTSGRGENILFHIEKVSSLYEFRVFCITELGITAQTDFHKFRNFLYYFLNDEKFQWLPDETIEARMKEEGRPLTRQTVASYKDKLQKADLISLQGGGYVYYFAFQKQQRIATKEEYDAAWREYWKDKEEYGYSDIAIDLMRERHGGVARKQAKADINGIYLPTLNKLNDLVCESIEAELICRSSTP